MPSALQQVPMGAIYLSDRAFAELAMNEIARSANARASSQLSVRANAMAATANPIPAYLEDLVWERFMPGPYSARLPAEREIIEGIE